MEIIFEILFSIVGELVLQVLFELLADMGITVFSKKQQEQRHPAYTAFGYVLIGSVAGGTSLLIFSESLIGDPLLKIAYIIIVPLFIGFIMSQLGKAKVKYGKQKTKLEGFFLGWIFALSFSLVRYFFAG